MAAKNKPNEIYISRIYDAPVKLVWDAWTDTAQVAKWWGPRGFTLTTHAKDFKVGGFWKYTMHGPDGTDYENKTIYHEIEKYSRLVYDHGGNDEQDRPPLFRVTVEFQEINKKTLMEMTMAFATPEVKKEMGGFIKKANGYSTWDRLAEYLDKETQGKEKFVINRSFNAPRETLFDVWSNPKHFSKWMGPAGSSMEFIRVDVKPGGSGFYRMKAAEGFTMYGSVHYIELTHPSRMVYTQDFRDENEKISRHPMAATWPETMLTTVTFTEEGPNQTRVTLEWEPHGKVSAEELATFIAARTGMTQGWTGSFDTLENYLTQL